MIIRQWMLACWLVLLNPFAFADVADLLEQAETTRLSDSQASEAFAQQALNELADSRAIPQQTLDRIYYYLAHAKWRQGKLSEALVAGQQAIQQHPEHVHFYRAKLLTVMAIVYKNLGQYDLASSINFDIIAMTEQLGEIQIQASAYNNQGNIFRRLQQFEKAEEFLRNALSLYQQAGFVRGESAALNNLAMLLMEQNNFQRALPFLQQSVELKRQNNLHATLPVSLANIAKCHIALKQFEQAKVFLEEGKQLLTQYPQRTAELELLTQSAHWYIQQSRFEEADVALQALESKVQEDLTYMKQYWQLRNVFYQLQEKWQQAYFAQQTYLTVSLDELALENQQRLSNLQVVYDMENLQRNARLQAQKAEAQALKLQQTRLSMILVGIGLLAAFITYRHRQVNKHRLLLNKERDKLLTAIWGSHTQLWRWDDTQNKFTLIYADAADQLQVDTFDRQQFLAKVHPDDQDKAREMLKLPGTQEIRLQQNKQWMWIRSRAKSIQESDRSQVLAGAMIDISALIQSQQALQQLNLSLEQKVVQRTQDLDATNQVLAAKLHEAELMQEQLVEQAKLNSLNLTMKRLSHELNTPIGNALTATSSLLESLNDNDKAKRVTLSFMQDALVLCQNSLHKSASLVDKLKNAVVLFDRQEPQVVNFKTAIKDAFSVHASAIKQQCVKLQLDDIADIRCKTDRYALLQALDIMIENSLLHAFDDTTSVPLISVEVHNKYGAIELIYRDNGRGLATDIQERMFQPFVSSSDKRDGSGLGLLTLYNLTTQSLNGQLHWSALSPQGLEYRLEFFNVEILTQIETADVH